MPKFNPTSFWSEDIESQFYEFCSDLSFEDFNLIIDRINSLAESKGNKDVIVKKLLKIAKNIRIAPMSLKLLEMHY